MARTAGNVALRGDSDALGPDAFPAGASAMVDGEPAFAERLRTLCGDVLVWDRVVFELEREVPVPSPEGARVRRLESADAPLLEGLAAEIEWICDTFDGARGTADSGHAWGAFVDGALASVAVPFYVGERFEDIGVVTEEAFRGRGLNPACAARVVRDVLERGRTPSWTTSPDNLPSRRVAEKLGFRPVRNDALYLIGMELPEVATPPTA